MAEVQLRLKRTLMSFIKRTARVIALCGRLQAAGETERRKEVARTRSIWQLLAGHHASNTSAISWSASQPRLDIGWQA